MESDPSEVDLSTKEQFQMEPSSLALSRHLTLDKNTMWIDRKKQQRPQHIEILVESQLGLTDYHSFTPSTAVTTLKPSSASNFNPTLTGSKTQQLSHKCCPNQLPPSGSCSLQDGGTFISLLSHESRSPSSSSGTPQQSGTPQSSTQPPSSPPPPPSLPLFEPFVSLQQKRDMIVVLGQALLNYGSPSYRVESGLQLAAKKLNLRLTFTFTPETLMITAEKESLILHEGTIPSTENLEHLDQHYCHHINHLHHHHHRHSQHPVGDWMIKSAGKTEDSIPSITMAERQGLSTDYFLGDVFLSNKENGMGISFDTDTSGVCNDKGDSTITGTSVDGQPWIILLKVNFNPDNAKLGQITHLMNRFLKDDPDLSFEVCLDQLKREIIAAPSTCNAWKLVLAYVTIGFSSSIIMFRGSWVDACCAALLGLLCGSLMITASHMSVFARVFEVSSCALVSLVARCLHRYCCFNATVIPSIVILLPGYAMTMAVMEITSKHIVTGSIRLIHVIFYSFLLAYGLELGSYLYDVLDPEAPSDGYCPKAYNTDGSRNALVPPTWVFIPLFPILANGISLSFGSSPRQWISEILCAGVGYCVSFFLGKIVKDGPILNAISAFVVGLYAHLALKITGEPPISPISVGITLLVPGSIGVESAYALLHQKDLIKTDFALQMLNIAIGLSVGLFASAMVVYPAGKRNSLLISL